MTLHGNSFSLEVLWSTEIIGAPPGSWEFETGLTVGAQSLLPDGRILWLGNDFAPSSYTQTLLVDAEHNRADRSVILKLEGCPVPLPPPNLFERLLALPGARLRPTRIPQKPVVTTLAVAPGGEIWVAGSSNHYMDLASYRHSDAYLARIDETGRPLWEKTYGDGSRRRIRRIAPMASGNLAVAGSDRREGWLAMVDPNGQQLWELRLGNDQDNAVAAISEDRLVVVGFETTGSGATKDFQQHATAWTVDVSGTILAKTRIRNPINRPPHSYFGRIWVAETRDCVYIASSWRDHSFALPVEVTKMHPDGSLLWKTTLPDTLKAVGSPTLAITPSGNAIIACALDHILIYQLNGSTGSYRESNLPFPECQSTVSPDLFLAVRRDGTMILSGSPPFGNSGTSCTWIGRLTEISQ
jgi:outer membrane protein assembly factor BamB